MALSSLAFVYPFPKPSSPHPPIALPPVTHTFLSKRAQGEKYIRAIFFNERNRCKGLM